MKLLGQIATAAACLASASAIAQAYPAKPIRMILTYSGGIDAVARLIAQRMTESMGKPVVVEGQAGAGGAIGATTVARAAPDGYTILSTTGSTQVQRGFMVRNVPYDPVKDYAPITLSWETMIVIGGSLSAPFSTFKDMLDYAKKNPRKISYATSGLGTSHHLALEEILLLTGVQMEHIPYKGGDQVITDVVAGRVPVASAPLFSLEPQVKAGKVRYLAVMNNSRFSGIPDVPSIREIVPGFESPPLWGGYFGPAGLPAPIAARLSSEILKALALPDVRTRMEDAGLSVVAGTPAQFAATMKSNVERLAQVMKAAGIEPE